MTAMGTLDFFAETIDHNKVKAEQFPPIEVLVLEAFTGEAHRALLLEHEWQLARWRQLVRPGNDDLFGPSRLRAANAESEQWRVRTRLAHERESFRLEQMNTRLSA